MQFFYMSSFVVAVSYAAALPQPAGLSKRYSNNIDNTLAFGLETRSYQPVLNSYKDSATLMSLKRRDDSEGSSGENSGGSPGDNSEGSTEDNSEGSTEDNSEGSTEDNSEGLTEDNSEGLTEDNSEGSTEDNSEGSTEDNSEGSTEDNSEGSTEDNSEGSTEDNSEGLTEDNSEGSTEDNSEGSSEDNRGSDSFLPSTSGPNEPFKSPFTDSNVSSMNLASTIDNVGDGIVDIYKDGEKVGQKIGGTVGDMVTEYFRRNAYVNVAIRHWVHESVPGILEKTKSGLAGDEYSKMEPEVTKNIKDLDDKFRKELDKIIDATTRILGDDGSVAENIQKIDGSFNDALFKPRGASLAATLSTAGF
ncbi:hypothetical protein BASA61_001372 [Batrachochytrium salamandrivorans]|nr:hypothetical protein BASA61_001372 [Batrachochytrium salamandrivorans]